LGQQVTGSAPQRLPLCVDLDGTLIHTDLLIESFARMMRQKPWLVFLVPFWLFQGKAALKHKLALRVSMDMVSLPYNVAFLEWLRAEKAAGRELVLVTAADRILAQQVADHLGLFDSVLASDGITNLKGETKFKTLSDQFRTEFEYAGNSTSDLAIWRHCRSAIAVNAPKNLEARIRKAVPEVVSFAPASRRFRAYVAALRPHQWVKNALVFIPLITAHRLFHGADFLRALLGAVCFSLCSSSQYILNDLADLEADRRHPSKRRRPFASGAIPLAHGFVMSPILLAASLFAAAWLSPLLLTLLILYFCISLTYSLYLKRLVLVDVFVLSGLYTSRVVAGHVATGIRFSPWLLSFSLLVFLSLALAKRYSELLHVASSGAIEGRGYRATDLAPVNTFGICSAFLSAIVFMLYIQSSTAVQLYHQPEFLWLLAPLALYWFSRFWLACSRGYLIEDPVIYVMKDKVTYMVGAVAALILFAATRQWSGDLFAR
jgi:4-hydroxybenzoate polyprenyltransferase/phosphoserine phosphatase